MIEVYEFGYPEIKRKAMFNDALKNAKEFYHIEYHGKYRPIPVVEMRIEVPVYRIENVRTKNLQKEWLAQHSDTPRDIFISDPTSIETQEIQHQILLALADKEGLLTAFKTEALQQTDPIICSDDGIVVNGNRRLCAWRSLYYSDKEKYKHFETIRIAVLPDHDPDAMYDLEVSLQIHTDMKADYAWHAIAADCKEKADRGIDISDIAKKQGKSANDINTYIQCYDYASEYLETIGHPDEWSLVDNQYYAFQRIVQGRKSLQSSGDKALFQEVAQAFLLTPARDERLYSQIPKVVKNLDNIAVKLQEQLDIEISDEQDEVLSILGDEDMSDNKAIIASGVRSVDNPALIVQIVKSVIDSTEELEREKKKKSFILEQVKKANTCLNNAVSNLDSIMAKEGIAKQIESIEAMLVILKDWIK